ncbi:MAG: hypothetical protein R3F37_12750 [Candidatus Competibacteraceae bacterium]
MIDDRLTEPRLRSGRQSFTEAFPTPPASPSPEPHSSPEQHGSKRTVKRFGEYIDTLQFHGCPRRRYAACPLRRPQIADTAIKEQHHLTA